jgi:hypothetical protein
MQTCITQTTLNFTCKKSHHNVRLSSREQKLYLLIWFTAMVSKGVMLSLAFLYMENDAWLLCDERALR